VRGASDLELESDVAVSIGVRGIKLHMAWVRIQHEHVHYRAAKATVNHTGGGGEEREGGGEEERRLGPYNKHRLQIKFETKPNYIGNNSTDRLN
jgi:hypothetical protein